MEEQTLKVKILRCLNSDYKHADYHRTIELALLYKQIVTKVEQDKLVISYKPSENETQKQQRINITKSKTSAVSAQVMSQFDYIKSTPRIVDSIIYVENAGDKVSETQKLNALVSRFYGRQTLQQYLEEKQRHYSAIDPNAWLIIELDEQGEAMPTTVNSENAIDFLTRGGITEYLITLSIINNVKYLYAYAKGIKIVYIQDNANATFPTSPNYVIENGYRVWVETNGTSETPAIRFGYTPDDSTDGRTFVGVMQPATEDYKDLINSKSELDLSFALHTFLKKYAYVDSCDYQDSETPHFRCTNGTLVAVGGATKGTCPSCKGSGIKTHTTTQEAILVKKPTEDMPSVLKLQDMEFYSTLPIDIVDRQIAKVDSIVKGIPTSIFGVDLNRRSMGFATATEINAFLDAIAMTLIPYSEKISQNYIFSVTAMAEIMSIDEGLIVSHKYPKRFKMETLGELLIMLNDAKIAGANSEILWNIEKQIAEIQNADNPAQILLMKVKRRYKPFKSLSADAQMLELANLPPDSRTKMLYSYLDEIFTAALLKYPALLQYDQAAQDKIIFEFADKMAATFTPIIPTL